MAGGSAAAGGQLARGAGPAVLSGAQPSPDCRLGVVALGDSLTNGHGGMQFGLGSQSWAQWLAQALDLPFTKLAADGASAPEVVQGQLPRLRGRYDLGCLWIGINDVRAVGWDPAAYARDLDRILAALAACCDALLTCTIPSDLGLPPAGAKVEEANRIIEAAAAGHGAVVCDLRGLRGARYVWVDRVHATALGQVEIADRAARALRTAGGEVPRDPSSLAAWHESRRARVGYWRHYAQRWVLEHADARRRLLAVKLGRPPR